MSPGKRSPDFDVTPLGYRAPCFPRAPDCAVAAQVTERGSAMNIVVLQGVVSRPAEVRELADGTTLALLDVATETANGRLVVPVAWPAPDRALPKDGIEVVVTGPGAPAVLPGRRGHAEPDGGGGGRGRPRAEPLRARRAVDEALAGAWGDDS